MKYRKADAMSVEERKRMFQLAVDEAQSADGASGTMLSCSDQSLDTVIELARHAQNDD